MKKDRKEFCCLTFGWCFFFATAAESGLLLSWTRILCWLVTLWRTAFVAFSSIRELSNWSCLDRDRSCIPTTNRSLMSLDLNQPYSHLVANWCWKNYIITCSAPYNFMSFLHVLFLFLFMNCLGYKQMGFLQSSSISVQETFIINQLYNIQYLMLSKQTSLQNTFFDYNGLLECYDLSIINAMSS